MGLWTLLTGKFRSRDMLAEPPDDDEVAKDRVLNRPPPTPTTRVPERPRETPTANAPDVSGPTAGTPSYGSQGGTPSTQRLHNPRHFR